ncbi:MAG: hypothetical protein J6C82_07025 [Clostridia bacterium]|nr:hypothetical protein [Clostridia bacterium]
MEYRFDQVKEIGAALCNDFWHHRNRGDRPEKGEAYENILTVNNFLPYDIDRTVTVDLDFEPDYPAQYEEPFGYERINCFKIYDAQGKEIPYQITEIKRDYLYCGRKDVHTVTFRANIPAFGTAAYKIVPHSPAVRYLEKMKAGMNFAENAFIRMDILPNGSLKITDKKTGKIYTELGNLVDDGEIGDGWYHVNPVNDRVISSCGGSCIIERVEYGPARCVFKVTREFNVPEEMITDKFGKHRSEKTVTLKFESYVGLSEESRFVDVKLCYNNIAKDHRLRMLIPTGIDADTYFSGQAFYCCERKTGIDYTTQDWRETDQYEKATNGIFGKRDKDGCGIAFVSAAGLHECAAYDDEDGSLSVTLSRSFRTTKLTNGETRCQINLPLEYSFILAPLDSNVAYSDLLRLQDILATDVMTWLKPVVPGTSVAQPQSRLLVGGKDIAVSIIKKAESSEKNAIIVRVFNASKEAAEGFIKTEKIIEKAEATNLNEEKISDMKTENNLLKFNLSPWKIATFKLYLKN